MTDMLFYDDISLGKNIQIEKFCCVRFLLLPSIRVCSIWLSQSITVIREYDNQLHVCEEQSPVSVAVWPLSRDILDCLLSCGLFFDRYIFSLSYNNLVSSYCTSLVRKCCFVPSSVWLLFFFGEKISDLFINCQGSTISIFIF